MLTTVRVGLIFDLELVDDDDMHVERYAYAFARDVLDRRTLQDWEATFVRLDVDGVPYLEGMR